MSHLSHCIYVNANINIQSHQRRKTGIHTLTHTYARARALCVQVCAVPVFVYVCVCPHYKSMRPVLILHQSVEHIRVEEMPRAYGRKHNTHTV